MNWELLSVVALAAVILIYVLRHLSEAIKPLKKELGD